MSSTAAPLTHYYLDGACVVCGHRAEDRHHSTFKEVFLESGELVYWTIALPGHGIVDETFAPTLGIALKIATERHGNMSGVTVRLAEDRLTLATTSQRYSRNPILAAVQHYGSVDGSRVWGDADLASYALACLVDPDVARQWTPELLAAVSNAALGEYGTDKVIDMLNEAEEILTRLDHIRIVSKES